MAAVAHASPADIRRLATVRIASYVPPAPVRTPSAVYRRRRMVAVLVAASLLALLVLAVGGLVGSFTGNSGAAAPDRPISPAAVYVVQPGDTFWDIARRLEPSSDPRPLVARLVAAHGSAVLVAGERLALPAAG